VLGDSEDPEPEDTGVVDEGQTLAGGSFPLEVSIRPIPLGLTGLSKQVVLALFVLVARFVSVQHLRRPGQAPHSW